MANDVKIENISKTFKHNGKEVEALKNVSFQIKKGEIFGLLGPNGAGKTTLINILTMVLSPDKGTAEVFGNDIKRGQYEILEIINSVSAESSFHHFLKVKHILDFYAKLYEESYRKRKKIAGDLMEKFEIEDLKEKKFVQLSTGQKMRVALAKSLVNSPKFLLLDGPTLGLDPDIALKTRELIKEINKEESTTILLTSHYMNEVENLCKRIAYIDKGKISDIGTITQLKKKRFKQSKITAEVTKIKKKKLLEENGFKIKGKRLEKSLAKGEEPSEIIKFLIRNDLDVIEFRTEKPTLEEYFIKMSRDEK